MSTFIDTSLAPMRWSRLVRSRAWVSLLILVPFVVLGVFSKPYAIEGTWGDIDCDFIGWLLFMIGAGWRWWATLYIGGRKHWMIVDMGAYSVCRNPLYVGTFCMTLGIAFWLESVTLGVGILLMAAYYLPITVSAEEQMLREKFGQQFDEYCRRVPRFWPRFGLLKTPPQIIVSVRGMRSELLRTSRWLWLPVLCEVVSHVRIAPWWPRLFHLP